MSFKLSDDKDSKEISSEKSDIKEVYVFYGITCHVKTDGVVNNAIDYDDVFTFGYVGELSAIMSGNIVNLIIDHSLEKYKKEKPWLESTDIQKEVRYVSFAAIPKSPHNLMLVSKVKLIDDKYTCGNICISSIEILEIDEINKIGIVHYPKLSNAFKKKLDEFEVEVKKIYRSVLGNHTKREVSHLSVTTTENTS